MSCRRHTAPAGLRSGTLISTPYEGGPVTQADTVQCVHCQYTSLWVADSPRWWSFCTKCAGLICGQRECLARGCVHKEQQLDNIERGLPLDYKPVIVHVPAAVPSGR